MAFNQDPVGAFFVITKIQRFVCSSSSSSSRGLLFCLVTGRKGVVSGGAGTLLPVLRGENRVHCSTLRSCGLPLVG